VRLKLRNHDIRQLIAEKPGLSFCRFASDSIPTHLFIFYLFWVNLSEKTEALPFQGAAGVRSQWTIATLNDLWRMLLPSPCRPPSVGGEVLFHNW